MRSNRSPHCLLGIFLSAIFFSTSLSANAQAPTPTPSPTPKSTSSTTLEHDFFKNILRDQKAIWTSPFHLHGRDARWLAPLGLGTAALIATDRNTADKMAEFQAQLNASRTISYIGSSYGAGSILGMFYLVGRATHNERARETGVLGAEALIDSEIVVIGLKEITQRRRPRALTDHGEFFEGGTSFPSGHSIHAWSVATVIANEYHEHRLVQFSAYGLAAAVSVARFTGRNHFLSDVLVGSVTGYGIGRYVYRTRHRKSSDSDDEEESRHRRRSWPFLAPQYDRRAREYGVDVTWSF